MSKEMFLFFGDSTVLGVGSSSSGWPELSGHYLKSRFFQENLGDFLFYNLGVDGDNSKKLLARLDREITARIRDGYRLTIFIAVGLNDSYYDEQHNKLNISLKQFNINLYKMLEICRKHSAELVLVTPIPVDENQTNPMPKHPERAYRNVLVEGYAQELRKFAENNEIKIIDFFNSLIHNERYNIKNNSYDGLHPNDMGYHILANCFVDAFEHEFIDRINQQ